MQSLVFGFNVTLRSLTIFASKSDAIASVEGIEIAEGDWRFFSASGSPLEAHFSTPPQIHHDRNTYTKGTYSLEPADTGMNLYTLLSMVSCDDQAQSGLSTLRDVEQFLLDQLPEPNS